MSRVYGKLMTSIWTDADFRSLSGAAQRLYMLLIASPKMNSAGVLPLATSRWSSTARDTTLEGTERALSELVDRGYIATDEATEEAWMRSFIRHDKAYRNTKMLVGLRSTLAQGIESGHLKGLAEAELAKCLREGRPMPDTKDGEGPLMPVPPTTPTPTPTTEAAAAEEIQTQDGSHVINAAVELLLLEKMMKANPHDRDAYLATLRREVPKEVVPLMQAWLKDHPDASPVELAFMSVGRSYVETNPYAPRPPENDPNCEHCAGSGWRTIDHDTNTVGKCDCTPTEAVVIEMRRAQ